MHRRPRRVLLLALLAGLGSSTPVGCGEPNEPHAPGPPTSAASETASDQEEAVSREALPGAPLGSAQTHPGGLGPNGEVPGHQHVGQEMDLTLSQELDALPPPVADFYCQGKLNSDGCVPSMSVAGVPSVTDPAPFLVEAQGVIAATPGYLIYGLFPAEIPFQAGFLCVRPPRYYSPIQISGGSGPCGGTFSFDFNATIQGASVPPALVGLQLFCQYGYADVGDPFGTGFTNALRLTIQP